MKILVIDDEPLARMTVLQELNRLGYTDVLEAENGVQGHQLILQEKPQLVIADICMSDLDGIALLQTIRKEGFDTLFVILSGYDLFQYAREALKSNAFFYLLKPVDQSEFQNMITTAEQALELRNRERQEKETMLRSLGKNRKVLLQQFLSDVVFGRKTDRRYIGSTVDTQQFRFPHPDYCVALFHMDSGAPNSAVADSGLLLYGIENIAVEMLETHGILAYGFVTGNDLCLLCNFESAGLSSQGELIRILEEIEYTCRRYLYSSIYVGVGLVCTIEQCYNSYCSAQQAIKLKIHTEHTESRQQDSSDPDAGLSILMDEQEKYLIRCIQEGRLEEAYHCLDRVFMPFYYSLKDQKTVCNNLCLYIIILYQRILDDLRLDSTEILGDEFEQYLEISGIQTVSDILLWLKEKTRRCVGALKGQQALAENNENVTVEQAAKYIQTHFAEPLTLDAVAEKYHFVSSYFSRLFKAKIGTSFLKYLTNCRIAEAKRLLIGTNLKVFQISKMVGFHDAKYFIEVFKNYTGQQPNAYREQFKTTCK